MSVVGQDQTSLFQEDKGLYLLPFHLHHVEATARPIVQVLGQLQQYFVLPITHLCNLMTAIFKA